MYHPQCELLMGHDTLDLDAGHPHLTAASSVATIPTELSFQLFHSLDAAAPQPTVDYFFGSADHQSAVQYDHLAPAGSHDHAMTMMRDYYPMGEQPYLRETRAGALVFGAPDHDESAAYMAGTFQSSPPPRATGGRKRSRAMSSGFHGGLVNGIEKKEKQRRSCSSSPTVQR
jgi:hypothetical protein